jgi:hypothetical protein
MQRTKPGPSIALLKGASVSVRRILYENGPPMMRASKVRECAAETAKVLKIGRMSVYRALMTAPRRCRRLLVFSWFKAEQRERRRKVRLDRKYLEARARRFLKIYLNANETRKPAFYRAVEEASRRCQPSLDLPSSELDDSQVAEATSNAAMKIVLERIESKKGDRTAEFVTDAYATVGIAYHRAAGSYTLDQEMQELGTAAVHLLTIASSFVRAHNE